MQTCRCEPVQLVLTAAFKYQNLHHLWLPLPSRHCVCKWMRAWWQNLSRLAPWWTALVTLCFVNRLLHPNHLSFFITNTFFCSTMLGKAGISLPYRTRVDVSCPGFVAFQGSHLTESHDIQRQRRRRQGACSDHLSDCPSLSDHCSREAHLRNPANDTQLTFRFRYCHSSQAYFGKASLLAMCFARQQQQQQ